VSIHLTECGSGGAAKPRPPSGTGDIVFLVTLSVPHGAIHVNDDLDEKILAPMPALTVFQPDNNIWIEADILRPTTCAGQGLSAYSRAFRQGRQGLGPGEGLIIPDHYIFTEDKMATATWLLGAS